MRRFPLLIMLFCFALTGQLAAQEPAAPITPGVPFVPQPPAPPAVPEQQAVEMPAAMPGPSDQSLTLQEAIKIALKNSPLLCKEVGVDAAAVARIGEARAAEGFQAKLSSEYYIVSNLPIFSIPPIVTPFSVIKPQNWITTLATSQVFYSGGHLQALVRQATDLACAAEANSQQVRQQVIYDTERTFELLVAAQQERMVAQQTLQAAESSLHDAEARFEARAAARYDVLRAQSTLMRTNSR